VSCSPNYLKGYNRLQNSDIKIPIIFNGQLTKSLYKANLKVMGNELSGVCIIKKTDDSEFRLVFMSEIGMKYFDISINYQKQVPDLKIYYFVSVLDRGEVKQIILNDIAALLNEFGVNNKTQVYKHEISGDIALKKSYDSNNYYSFRYSGKNKIKIVKWKSKPEGKSEIFISEYDNNLPSDIKIKNSKYSTSLSLRAISDLGK
jgi:hypothetical protein